MENPPAEKKEEQVKAVLKVCTRCGGRRKADEYAIKRNGEPYKTCEVCRSKQSEPPPTVAVEKHTDTPAPLPEQAPSQPAKQAEVPVQAEQPVKRKVRVPPMK